MLDILATSLIALFALAAAMKSMLNAGRST